MIRFIYNLYNINNHLNPQLSFEKVEFTKAPISANRHSQTSGLALYWYQYLSHQVEIA